MSDREFTRETSPLLWKFLHEVHEEHKDEEFKLPDLRNRQMTERFEVTEDHLKLVQQMYWDWNDSGYGGAPGVGLKRPYGNSDIGLDIAEILGWDYPDEDEVSPREFDERVDDIDARAMKIHREMDTVLQIATCTLTWASGMYEKTSTYDSLSWRRVE